jgi:hypothetical protein
MTQSLTKLLLLAAIALGISTAHANDNFLPIGTTSFSDVVGRNTTNYLSTTSKFTISDGLFATLTLPMIGSKLSFDQVSLLEKVTGGWRVAKSDNNHADGLFTFGPGTYKLQFQFDSFDGNKALRTFSSNLTVAAVPEPESYAMLIAGLGLVGALARRRRKQA